jgi:hypothetical protein
VFGQIGSVKQPLPLDPESPDVELIQGRVARLLLSVCEGTIAPARPLLPGVVSGKWGEFTLAGGTTEWLFEKADLDLALHGPAFDVHDGLAKMFGVLNEPGEFVLQTGDTLKARFVHGRSRRQSIDFERKTAVTTHTLRLDSWTWSPRTADCLWLGVLDGTRFDDANLLLHGKDWWTSNHLRLQGHYDLYIVTPRNEGPVVLVVDTRGGPIDHGILGTDILALEFVLGRPLQLNHLTAIDAEQRVVGAAGLGIGGLYRGGGSDRCPVGGRRELYSINDEGVHEHIWVPVLFELVAHYLHQEGQDSPIWLSIRFGGSTGWRERASA